jgi:hypothetical protein
MIGHSPETLRRRASFSVSSTRIRSSEVPRLITKETSSLDLAATTAFFRSTMSWASALRIPRPDTAWVKPSRPSVVNLTTSP